MLCFNRPEGFGPSSTITSPLPTQCFFDTILVPLPSWLLLSLLALPAVASYGSPATRSKRMSNPRRGIRLVYGWFYYFCIFVVVLMETVEIARLAVADLGVALIPFVYVGCLLVVALQVTDGLGGRIQRWQVFDGMFWLGSILITALKTGALSRLGGDLSRAGTKYPVSDQLTDLAVLIAFYTLLLGLEIGMVYMKTGVDGTAGAVQLDAMQVKP